MLLAPASRYLHSQCLLDSVNQIRVIRRGTIFQIDDLASLLIDSLGQLSLGPLLLESGLLNGCCTFMGDGLELDLLVLVLYEVILSDIRSLLIHGGLGRTFLTHRTCYQVSSLMSAIEAIVAILLWLGLPLRLGLYFLPIHDYH